MTMVEFIIFLLVVALGYYYRGIIALIIVGALLGLLLGIITL